MSDCRCEVPRADPTHPNPVKRETCRACGCSVNPSWSPTDRATSEFFERLAEGMFPAYAKTRDKAALPPLFEHFRELCRNREARGRERFGFAYLGRDNCVEAQEEVADFSLYMMLAALKNRRAGRDENLDVALTAAYHAYMAYRFATLYREKEQGAP